MSLFAFSGILDIIQTKLMKMFKIKGLYLLYFHKGFVFKCWKWALQYTVNMYLLFQWYQMLENIMVQNKRFNPSVFCLVVIRS